jgi:DNA-binding MarR family transcriptional regulator
MVPYYTQGVLLTVTREELMERKTNLLPRQQIYVDLARQVPSSKTLAVETSLLFHQVAREVFIAQQEFYNRFELSDGKLVLLLLLQRAPNLRLTPSQLSEYAGVTRGTITGLLSSLERSGLVTRLKHPEDGRMFMIELTESALTLIEHILPERLQRHSEFMSLLTEEEQHQLIYLLEKLTQRLPELKDS